MRFASLGGSGNFAQAGIAAGREGEKTFRAVREHSPDFQSITEKQIDVKSKQNVAQTKADRYIAEANINADAKISVAKEDIKQDNIIKGSRRKAGVVAAMGKAGMGIADAFMGKPEKRDFSTLDAKIKSSRDKAAALRGEADAINTEFKPASTTPAKTSGAETSDVSSPLSSGTAGDGSGWSRMSKVIKTGEGTLGDKGYTTQFTGRQFSDMSKHPAQINSANGLSSDAAGAYQFLSTTYNPAAKALGITDFSPESQEKVGKYLAQQRGMNTDIVHTDKASFLKALDKIAPEWASMPTVKTGTSYYGQGGLTPDEAWNIYNS